MQSIDEYVALMHTKPAGCPMYLSLSDREYKEFEKIAKKSRFDARFLIDDQGGIMYSGVEIKKR